MTFPIENIPLRITDQRLSVAECFQESQAEGAGCFHRLVLCLGVESGALDFHREQTSRLKSQTWQRMTASLEVNQRLLTGFCPNF